MAGRIWHPIGTKGSKTFIMIFSYFKYAFRNLVKQRGRALINLFGLSFGIAVVIIIYLYSSWELSYNNFHERNDRIYRMYSSADRANGEKLHSPFQSGGMAFALKEKVPGIEQTCRLKSNEAWIGIMDKLFQEDIGFVDSTFFDIFSFEILAGDKETPLSKIKSVVLTETVARKIFGDSLVSYNDVIGKSIEFPEEPPFDQYELTAVIADPPKNSSFKWSVLIPYVNSRSYPRSNDFSGDTYIYVMLDETNDLRRLEETSQTLVEEFHGERLEGMVQVGYLSAEHHFTYHFKKFKDLYLGSEGFEGDYEHTGNKKSIYILSSIALLILLIACFNYVMISIGAALNRIRDFGIMNVVGASRWQILAQFIIESFVLTMISLLMGIILAEQLLPLFNRVSQGDLEFALYSEGRNFVFLALIMLFIVISTSLYIGLYLLRKSHALHFLKKEMLSVRRNGVARISVVLQFFIAIVLLVSGGVILKQLNFMINRDVGFDRDKVVVIPVDFSLDKVETLKEKILESPHVKSVSMSDRSFTSGSSSQGLQNKEGELTLVRFLRVDADYIQTLGLELTEGRNFFQGVPIDSNNNVLVNETLVRNLRLEDPIGEQIELNSEGSDVMTVIGVVKDFHFDPMHREIDGLMMHVSPRNSIWYMFVRTDPDVGAVLEHSEKVWKEVVPEFSWDYSFLSDLLESQYRGEDRWSRIVAYAAIIAILLSCLGLMGISGLLVARRFKEVGIRKAHGAKVSQIIVLLNIELLKWVLVAYLLACPASWFIMRRWLQDFAFRTQLSWWIFVLAGLAAILISIFTITLQIYRVARQNPVNALRYE